MDILNPGDGSLDPYNGQIFFLANRRGNGGDFEVAMWMQFFYQLLPYVVLLLPGEELHLVIESGLPLLRIDVCQKLLGFWAAV